jgi:DNA-binding CsgD family transcriptional regulator/PAS domain-containing protein
MSSATIRLEKQMGMARVPSGCFPDFMEFARIAGIAQDTESLSSNTLHLIRRIFRSDSTIIWRINQNNRIVDPVEVNVQDRFFPLYRDYYYKKNPFDPVNMGAFAGTSVSMEQIVPYNDFQKTEYYNDFIRPQKIRRQMVVYIRTDKKPVSLICTHRFSNTRFNKEDLAAGDLVSFHLAAAFERIRLMEEVKRKGSIFQMILESADVGIAALDAEKTPVFINREAVRICEEMRREAISRNDLCSAESVIPPALLKDCEAIEKTLKDRQKVGIKSLPMRERTIWLSPHRRCRFRCSIVNSSLTDFNHPLFLITMESVPAHPRINDQTVKRDYNLTNREAEIVSYIFKGYKNADIADRLFICEGTVKNHLRNIFEKVDVKNRTGLIHRLLSLCGNAVKSV